MLRHLLVLAVFVLAVLVGRAQQYPAQAALPAACPWLTQGSAERALGGEAAVAVHLSSATEGICTFALNQEPNAVLKLEVSKAKLPSCGANGTKLKGIGNEAMQCSLPGSTGANTEMISSRVRDLHFTLTLMPGGKKSPANAPGTQNDAAQDDALEQIAELVAGNLF